MTARQSARATGVDIAVHGAIGDGAALDLLLVCAGTRDAGRGDATVCKWLRGLAHRGTSLGGISLGAYVLARAGLLDVHRCALHWESLAAFSEEFPRIRTTPDIFVVDGNRRTCSGGTAALDMMLHLITERESRELANNVPALASASTLAARARAVAEPSRRLRRTRVDDRGDLDAGAVQRQRGIVTTVVIAEHDGAPARAHGELADVALRAPASSVPGRSLFA